MAVSLWLITHGMHVENKKPLITHELNVVSYVILATVLLIIMGGLGWCFYRALAATGEQTSTANLYDETNA